MKVKDLILKLQQFNPELDVLTKDYRCNEDFYVKNIEVLELPINNSVEFIEHAEVEFFKHPQLGHTYKINLTENVIIIRECKR